MDEIFSNNSNQVNGDYMKIILEALLGGCLGGGIGWFFMSFARIADNTMKSDEWKEDL